MAQRTEVITYRTDDLDGTDLGKNGTTVEFAVNGTAYEIDLSEKNAKLMMDALGQYMEHARKPTHRRGRRSSAGSHTVRPMASEETKAARAWLVEKGLLAPESRGRISAENMERFRSRGQMAMSAPAPAERAPSLQETKKEVPAAAGTAGKPETAKAASGGNSTTAKKTAPKVSAPA